MEKAIEEIIRESISGMVAGDMLDRMCDPIEPLDTDGLRVELESFDVYHDLSPKEQRATWKELQARHAAAVKRTRQMLAGFERQMSDAWRSLSSDVIRLT